MASFGQGIGESMVAGFLAVVVVAAGIAIALWELGKWVFNHLSIGWN